MTREEAKEAKVEYLDCNDNLVMSNIPTEDCHDLIDEIYDDFESRVCYSCAFFIPVHEYPMGELKDIFGTYVKGRCIARPEESYNGDKAYTFGCNKWETNNE